MAGAGKDRREDGERYASGRSDIDAGVCRYCGNKLEVYTEGRPPKYCGSTCRSGAWRGSHPSMRTRYGRGTAL